MMKRRNSRSIRVQAVTALRQDPYVPRSSRKGTKPLCNHNVADEHRVPTVAKVIGKPVPKKRKPRAPQADANNGGGEALGTGPDIDAAPASQTRNAGRPKRYIEVQQATKRYSLRSNHIEGQVAQLKVRIPTAEQDAEASSSFEAEGESQQQLDFDFDVEGAEDSRARGSSSVLLNTAMDDGIGIEAARRQQGHQCYKCGAEESPAWRHGKESGLFHAQFFCNSCGTQQRRHGAEFDPITGQVTYPTTPQGKDRARGRAGKGGQAVVPRHDFDAILEAAAAAEEEEGNLLQHGAELVGDSAELVSGSRTVDSRTDSRTSTKDVGSGRVSGAAERQAAVEQGESSGQQKRKMGAAGRAQSEAGAEAGQNASQQERQQGAQLAASKTAARQLFDSHVGSPFSCSGSAPSRKRGASAISQDTLQHKKRTKTVIVAALSNTAAHAAGVMQHVQLNGTAGRGQDGLRAEVSRKIEVSGSSQHRFESAEDQMVERADNSDEQEAADALLCMGNNVA